MKNLKRPLVVAVAFAMLLSLVACAAPAELTDTQSPEVTQAPVEATPVPEQPVAQSYTPGTYTAAGRGNNGDVTVSVTFSSSAITEVVVTGHSETAGIGDVAVERLPARITEYQSLAVDAISGATNTSHGILEAVEDCVVQAGGNVEALKTALPESVPPEISERDEKVDVIIVGGGGAGLSAAVTATQAGASVVLVEKTAMLGGNTMVAGPGWNSVYPEEDAKIETNDAQLETLQHYLEMDPSLCPEYEKELIALKQQITEYLAGDHATMFDSVEFFMLQTYFDGLRTDLNGDILEGNYYQIKKLCEKSNETLLWVKSFGVQFASPMTKRVGCSWQRSIETTTSGGSQFFDCLTPVLTENNVPVLYETKAEKLLTDEAGKVIGVECTKADGSIMALYADKGVILTTGGFGANTAMVQEYNTYWPSISDDTKTTCRPCITGDGILLGQAVGANVVGMGAVQFMPAANPDTGSLYEGYAIFLNTSDWVAVNQEGKRFVNEAETRDNITKAALSNGGRWYLVATQKMIDDSTYEQSYIDEQVAAGNVLKANTLEELAGLIGCDATAFTAEMDRYNSFVDAAKDDDFGTIYFGNKVEGGPFYACPRQPAIHFTMGGLEIDENARVLSVDGTAIDGLYAAGEVTGGLHGGNRVGGNAIADAFVFGRIAVQTVLGIAE